MKTTEELEEKIVSLKAMGSPSALSKARELEWVLGTEEEPDEESDMIVDALMKGIDVKPSSLWDEVPEFAHNHKLYTFWKPGQPIKVQKPANWDEQYPGTRWDEATARNIRKWELESGKGKPIYWKEVLGVEGFKKFLKDRKTKKKGDKYEVGFYTKIPDEAATIEDAELITSLTHSGSHSPLLDLDLPAVVIPSSTPGHGHLYIDKELSWKDYQKLLNVLADLGIIETGYRGASIARGYSALRLPWVKKETVGEDKIEPFEH